MNGMTSYSARKMIKRAGALLLAVAMLFSLSSCNIVQRIQKRFESRTIDTAADIADWNAGKIPVALIHPASGGHGLNLQEGGSTIVWFGLTWSLELYQQLNARLWRQGQKERTVVITHIVTTGTHDEDVLRALERKDAGQAALIAAVKARIGGAQ